MKRHSTKFAPRSKADFLADAKELITKLKTGHANSADIETFVCSHRLAGPAWRQAQVEIEEMWTERMKVVTGSEP